MPAATCRSSRARRGDWCGGAGMTVSRPRSRRAELAGWTRPTRLCGTVNSPVRSSPAASRTSPTESRTDRRCGRCAGRRWRTCCRPRTTWCASSGLSVRSRLRTCRCAGRRAVRGPGRPRCAVLPDGLRRRRGLRPSAGTGPAGRRPRAVRRANSSSTLSSRCTPSTRSRSVSATSAGPRDSWPGRSSAGTASGRRPRRNRAHNSARSSTGSAPRAAALGAGDRARRLPTHQRHVQSRPRPHRRGRRLGDGDARRPAHRRRAARRVPDAVRR